MSNQIPLHDIMQRSRLDTLCEILLVISKESLTPWTIRRKANVGYDKVKEYLELLMDAGFVECRRKTIRYGRNKPYDRVMCWEERTHRLQYVYRTTEKGLEIVQAWIKIKESLVPLFLKGIPKFLGGDKT